ncbi:unnamed protein product [Lactuca virosa]|uniref:DUF1985 domain-containing protein n=1 Tax=Lactuca virosa TaxID=75947 RepID=A0AAU9NAU5_9ASTR|nr:unnamed protein product [Lactuca virosa]
MAHSTNSDSDFVSTAVPNDESDEEIYVKKRTGDRKYLKGVTKIKEAKRKRNSGDNRAAIKKQKTVKEQKTVKDILKELPSINTRSTPGLTTDVVSYLTSEQKDWVKRMGFKAFLKIKIKITPLKLCHFVLEHYDEGTNSILIKGKRINITKEKIHKVFGLLKTGKSLFDLDMVSEDHQVFDGWMKELEGGKEHATNYKKIIQKSEQVDMNFKLGFIALFVNTFAESIPMGTNNLVPVRALVEVDDISKIDWCASLLYCVKNSKGIWRPDNPKCYYRGPMLLLLLIYCDEIECKLQKNKCKTPLVTMWTADKLKERQSFEIEAGGFGVGNLIEQSSNLEREKNENQDTRIEKLLRRELKSTADRDEELNKTNISDFDDDKDEGMNTKLVAFLAVKPLQQKFPDNEERQEDDQDMNVDDPINLGLENNIGEETIRHPHNPERQIEFECINVDDKINLALEVNNIDETIGKKNLEENVESKNLVEGGEMIGGEKIREGNIVEKVVGDNIETGDNSEGNDEDGELEGNEEHILDEKRKKGQNVNERGKRKVTNPDFFRSPFVNRVIDLSEKVSTRQEIMAQIMFRCVGDKDPMEMLFETESGDIMDRVHFEGMRPNHKTHPFLIDCWAAVLNFEEENLRNKKSPPRVFFNTQIMPHGKYMGEKEEKWDVELGEESVRTSKKIAKLRTFYVAKLANHQINKQRKLNVAEALEFSKLDKKTRCMSVKEGSEARDNLEMKKV